VNLPSWRALATVKVSAKPDGFWTLVHEYVAGGRLLRFQVRDKDKDQTSVPMSWSPADGSHVTADGIAFSGAPKTGVLSTAAPYGALVGKVGGSSADLPDSASAGTPYGTKKTFVVGAYCIVALAASDGGPLFLSMNDNPEGFAGHSGALHVLIEEYPL